VEVDVRNEQFASLADAGGRTLMKVKGKSQRQEVLFGWRWLGWGSDYSASR
jgi:hypothetical protein